MRRCTRGPEPEPLARHGAEIGRAYATRRLAEPTYRFQWRQSLLEAARDALRAMTDARCSYCDGHPIDAMGEETVDHFRPKGRPEFYELVCAWTNLFLACPACNNAKQDQWDETLLRPDDADFRFERYFEYRFDSGEIHPAPTASPADQSRARRTIEILELNRAGACWSRRFTVKSLLGGTADDEDVAYRYLIPLCREVRGL